MPTPHLSDERLRQLLCEPPAPAEVHAMVLEIMAARRIELTALAMAAFRELVELVERGA